MHLSGSQPDPARLLVCDASFWINLVASNRIELLLESLGTPSGITDIALGELEWGRTTGRVAADVVGKLVRQGTIEVVCCAPDDEEVFLGMVVGSAAETLDDGEAATLVCAARLGSPAVIDESKATKLAAIRFPRLRVLSTVGLMLDPAVRGVVGDVILADAIFDALTGARMRVPPQHLANVVALVGPERVALCRSLPNRVRMTEPVRKRGRVIDLGA